MPGRRNPVASVIAKQPNALKTVAIDPKNLQVDERLKAIQLGDALVCKVQLSALLHVHGVNHGELRHGPRQHHFG